jgi:DNA-binding SARP family transcriptional activator
MIELRSLGTAEIDTGTSTLTPSQEIVFGAALYLILERGNHISRKHLASLLWPAVPEKARAHRLRQTILQLKKLGLTVKADRDNLSLSDREVRRDVDALSSSEGIEALGHGSLAFLPGYSPRFSEPLRDWLDSKRSAFHAEATRPLVHELEHSRLQADWAMVEKMAAKCLALDEYNETAVLARAEAAAMRGAKHEAMSILDRYIAEVGSERTELRLPATLLRRRIVERIPDRPPVLNGAPPFVGREAEMAALTGSFGRANAGAGSATLITGEPGIGKSRLSAQLARFAELQGAAVQRATCRRTDIDRPLSLFVDIVPQLRELPGALGCAPDTFAALKRLTEFEQRPDDSGHPDYPEMLFQGIRTALFDLVDSLADERCLVLLVEDVQWLDNASWKILAQMVEWAPSKRVFFLLNSRPGNNNAFGELAESALVRTLHLGPLTETSATTLLRSLAQQSTELSDASFIGRSLAVAEGNPFFLQELAHHWAETGGRYEAPPSVAKVLQDRLARLSAEGLHVLQTCAVLGECATIDRVEKVLAYQPHMLLAAIEELSKAAMLNSPTEEIDLPNGRLQPRHDFLSFAAIDRLAPLSLAFIHRRSADVLEAEIAHNTMPTTLLWACASHRHHAGDRERALSLTMACAEHLLEVGLAREASTAFQRSLEYCVRDAQRLRILPRLALAFELEGDWENCRQTLNKCNQIFTQQDASNGKHNEYELRFLDARFRSALDFANLLEETILCVASKDASPAHRVKAAVLAMKMAVDFGESDRADWLYREVSSILGDPSVCDYDRLELEMIQRTDRGDGVVPLGDLHRFTQAARQSEGEIGYSRALLTAAAACRRSARYEEGLAFVSLADNHAKSNKLHAKHIEVAFSAVLLHTAAGNFAAASQALKEARKYQLPTDNNRVRNAIHYHAARLALEDGDLAVAATEFESIDTPASTSSHNRKGFHLALEVRIRVEQGWSSESLAPVVAQLEEHHLRMRGCGGQDFESHATYIGLCAVGESQRADDLLTAYVDEHRRSRWPLPREIVDILSAKGMSCVGPEASNGHFSRSLDPAGELTAVKLFKKPPYAE